LTGTLVPGATRTSVVAKSPLTGIFGEASVGGTWGAECRFAGLDAIVIIGAAQEPVYLWIQNDAIEIRPAAHLWGKDTFETSAAIRSETDHEARVGCIGPAGESLSRIAAIMFEGELARAAGRTGLGAVMGSKRLKGVAVKGFRGLAVAEPGRLLEWGAPVHKELETRFGLFATYGTTGSLEMHEERGALGIKNFSSGDFKAQAPRIGGKAIHEQYPHKQSSCSACPVHCWVVLNKRDGSGTLGRGPEYETLGSFGAMLMIDDLDSVVRANEMANRLGLDTISLGNTIAFAIEAFERGLIDEGETGGLTLRWGDPHVLLALIEKIARREEGIGQLLADGSRAAARKIGKGADALTVEVKGLELPMHDARAFWSSALNYACGSRGACHLDAIAFAVESGVRIPEFGYNSKLSPFSAEGKPLLVKRMHDLMAVYNATGMCKFYLRAVGGPVWLADAINMTTGWGLSPDDLMVIGDRIFTLKRVFNVRAGVTRADDTLPERIATLDRNERHRAVPRDAFEQMRDEYYRLRGWSHDGHPTGARLKALGLTGQEAVFLG
ncbi:MAG: aldehyde ferredoxin oxidoreductase family protein, partial [Candidatus Methylomirabilaceae bacterium]